MKHLFGKHGASDWEIVRVTSPFVETHSDFLVGLENVEIRQKCSPNVYDAIKFYPEIVKQYLTSELIEPDSK